MMPQQCVCRDIERLGSLKSTQKARVALCATLTPLSCSPNFPRHTLADAWTYCWFVPINLHRCWSREWKRSIWYCSYSSEIALLVFTRRHGGHVGDHEQNCLSSLRTKRHFQVNSSKHCLLYRAFSHDVTAAILVFQNNKTAAMLVFQTSPVGVELFSYVNTFFCSNKFNRYWSREWKRSIDHQHGRFVMWLQTKNNSRR